MVEGARRPSFALAAVATYGTNVIVATLGLANVLVISWALGPEGRGEIAFLTTVAYLTASLATLGVEQSNANLGGSRPELRRALAGNSLAFAILVGGLAAAVVATLFVTLPGTAAGTTWTLRIVALCAIPVLMLYPFFDYLVRASYGHMAANVAWLAQPVTTLTANAAFAIAGELTVGRALATWFAGQALLALILAAWIARRSAGFGAPDPGLAKTSLGFGIRAHAGRVMTLGNYRLDQWILGGLAGQRELGLYSVAVAWAEALFYLPTALSAVQRPDLVRAGEGEAASRAAVVFRTAILATIPLALIMVLAAPILCTVIFPDTFRGSIDDLRVLALGGFGIVALKLLGNALTARGRPLLATAGVGVAFVLTIVLDAILIPEHGGLGAAIASTVAYSAGGLAIVVIFLRALGGRPRDLGPRPGDAADLVRAGRRLLARGRN
jgi:O-antigen/teichoic acid export membrane protein